MEAQEYKKLVKALRHCNGPSWLTCQGCQYNNDMMTCAYKMLRDAAAAIEELQETLEAVQKNSGINFRMWEEAQAEALEAAQRISELEKELEIWTARSFEGKIASMAFINLNLRMEISKLKAQLPKRGKWVGVSPMVDTVQCSICGGQLFSAELETPYCPYCGAKMEVQE